MSSLITLALEALGTYLNRVVVLVTPFFAAAAAYVVGFVVENVPGAPELDDDQLTALMVAGALAAAHAATTWLKGWSQHEQNELLGELQSNVPAPPAEDGPSRIPQG